jgi:hypothetical protein
MNSLLLLQYYNNKKIFTIHFLRIILPKVNNAIILLSDQAIDKHYNLQENDYLFIYGLFLE